MSSDNNILIIVSQHDRHNSSYMMNYELGDKPINSIWINYYHLKKHFINHHVNFYPVNLNNYEIQDLKKRKFTFCIAIFNDLNGFAKNNVDHFTTLKMIKNLLKIPFYLYTEVVPEHLYECYLEYFNLIFSNRASNLKKVHSLGFAANHEKLFPNKDPTKLHILVDHPAYELFHFNNYDKSKDILKQIFNYKNFNKELVVRRFVIGDIETVDKKNYQVELYNRQGVNILKAYDEYNKCDIFIVTHPESMGMSVIECAMSGALILTPKDYINKEFLQDINYIEFENKIDWELVKSKLNPELSRTNALKHTWTRFYNNMLKLIVRNMENDK